MTREDFGRRVRLALNAGEKPGSTAGPRRANVKRQARAAPRQEGAGSPWVAWLRSKGQVCFYLLLTMHFLLSRILGVAIRFGKFSAKENKQLEKNVEEFLSLTGIENADKLLYTDRYPEEKAAITDLKRKYAFRLHIGKWRAVHSDQPQPSALKRETRGKYLAPLLARCALTAAVANRILTGSLRFRGLGMCSCLPHVELYRF